MNRVVDPSGIIRRGEPTVLRAGMNLNATVHFLVYRQHVYLLRPSKNAPFSVPIYEDDKAGSIITAFNDAGEPTDVKGQRVPDYSHSLDAVWPAVQVFFDRYPEQRGAFFQSLEQQAVGVGEWVKWPQVLVEVADRFPEAICQAIVVALRGDV